MSARRIDAERLHQFMRYVFWPYAIALVVATHWPRLQLPDMGVDRPDIFVHLGVFGVWTLLFLATGYSGRTHTWRVVGFGWVIALVYAAIDEATQALPGVNRNAAWDDYGANALGITLACILWGVVIRPFLTRQDLPKRGLIQP